MLARIRQITQTLTPRLIEIRRHLHRYPELSGQEHQTAAYVAGVLSSAGLTVQQDVGKVGVIAELAGNPKEQRLLAIRTDMDALPIQERTGLEFSSKHSGVMHACGHDVHTTVGLGTAMVLAALKEEFPPGAVYFSACGRNCPRGELDDCRWRYERGECHFVAPCVSHHSSGGSGGALRCVDGGCR